MYKYLCKILRADLRIVLRNMSDNIINNVVFCSLVAMISGYVLKAFGTSPLFAKLQVGSLIVSSIGFETYRSMAYLLSDIEGDRNIQYYFTLPISHSLIFIKNIFNFVLLGFIYSLVSICVLQIILPHYFSIASINWPVLIVATPIIASFFGAFSLLLTAYTSSLMKISNVVMRILMPLWIIGGFQFSYKVACGISPILGYLVLLSPYTYANEAVRYAVLGAEGFMNIYVSLSVLVVCAIISWCLAIKKLKKRLDFC